MSLVKIVVLCLVLAAVCFDSVPDSSQIKKVHRQALEVSDRIEASGVFDEMSSRLNQATRATMGSNPEKRLTRFLQRVVD
jgi:hypothetical protein